MNYRFLALIIVLLLIGGLSCQVLTEAVEPTVTPTAVATPTLAPTATPDPNMTPLTDLAGQQATEEAGPLPGEEESGAEGNASPTGEASSENSPTIEATPESVTPPDGEGPSDGGSDGGAVTGACPSGGQNLLANPSFEGQYKAFGAFKELNHAPNWFPWWQDGANNLRPEFKPAEAAIAPNRVHGGNAAQQYFKSFGQFKAGMYQSVLNVTPGSRLQFSAHGQAWSCEEFSLCPGGTSVNPANMLMRVGIDPTGNNDWSADTVVWSAYFNPLDQWQIACIEAIAERDVVTVFLWASPDGPRQNQDVYWDDAALVVVP